MTRVVIGDLDPYTTYVCVVAAETSVGVGPFSHLFFVQTDESCKKLKSLLLAILKMIL